MTEDMRLFEQRESTLRRNLEAINSRFPGFGAWLHENAEARDSLSVVKTGSHWWLVNDDEKMMDRYDADEAGLSDTKHAIWVVLGLGTGGAILDLSVERRQHVARVFILETDPAVWWAALQHSDLTPLFTDQRVFPLWNRDEIRDRLFEGSSTLLLLGLWREPLYIRNRGEVESRERQFAEDLSKIRDHLFVVLRSMGNSAEDTLVGFRQMMMNIPGMLESYDITDLADAFGDYPAVIVGAGPSLDKNYKLLHEIKDRSVIISSDTALRKLLADDIHPHIVVSLERGLIIYQKHFANLPKIPEGTVLFVQSVCVPEMAGTWQGGPFCLGFKWGLPLDHWFSGLTHLPLIRSGASCTHLAYTLALMMGCRKIALIGQDLAYAPDGATHSSATAWDGQTKDTLDDGQSKYITVPGNLGEEVLTHDIWLLFKRIFEEWYEGDRERYEGLRLFNATEGGAVIEGAEIVALREFIDSHAAGLPPMPRHPGEILTRRPLQEGEKRGSLQRGFDEALQSVDIMRKGFDRMREAAEEVAKPLLSSGERQRRAARMGEILDGMIVQSPLVTYVYQSHIALMSGDLLPHRAFSAHRDTGEWSKRTEEFIEAAETIFDHLEANLRLALAMLEETPMDSEHLKSLGRDWGPLDAEAALEAWRSSRDKELPLFALRLCAHYDFSAGAWPAEDAADFGRMLLVLGSVERARHILRQASQSATLAADPRFYNDLGVAFMSYELGVAPDCDNAYGCFAKAYSLDPNLESVHDNLVACEQIIRKGARMTLALKKSEHEKGVSLVLAESYARLHQWEEALEWFTRAAARFKEGMGEEEEHRLAEVYVKTAGCLTKLGRVGQAEASYIEAVTTAPEDKKHFYRWELLRHYLREGDSGRSREVFRSLAGTDDGLRVLEKNRGALEAFASERRYGWLAKLIEGAGIGRGISEAPKVPAETSDI